MSVGSRIRWFYQELKRRHVIRVVVTYAAVAWLVVQIGETTFEPLGLPPGALTFVVVLALLGFPVAAVLAWTLQVVREGQGRADDAGRPATGGAAPADDPAPLVLSDLPAPTTPLVGRGRELEDAERLITGEGCRVLTVLGPAGVGKTRFTVELAGRVAPGFRNGVCFAAVARLHSIDALPFLLAERLGVGFAPGTDAWQATLGFLREKQVLLVIDNFEQLTEASGLLAEIVATAPGVVLLVTSRERLDLQGETALRLEGLPCPAADEPVEGNDAVRLFVQSARRVDRRFDLDPSTASEVGRICRLVEGLPLALELAAACVGVLSPAEIAREIEQRHDFPLDSPRDRPPRHRSLRAAFESSWSLLSPGEREAFRRLAAFHGGFDRQAAETVAGADLRTLAALVDKSLLRRHVSGRFDLLEIVRQFGREKLAADPEMERVVRDRHAEQSIRVLEGLVQGAQRGEMEAALSAAARDAENIRAAWQWLVERGDTDRLRRGGDGLYRLWEARGWIEEGRELFRRAGAAVAATDPSRPDDPALAASLLAREGAFAEAAGAYDHADRLLQRALSLLPAGQQRERAFILQTLSWVARAQGDFEAEGAHARESFVLFERTEDVPGMAAARTSLGAHAYYRGDYGEAKRCFRESLALHRRSGATQGVWKQLNNLAGVAMAEGDYDEATRLLEEILGQYRQHGNRLGAARALYNLGLVAHRAGEDARSAALLADAIGAAREAGLREVVVQGLISLGDARVALGDTPGALEAFRRASEEAAEVGHLPLSLEILLGLARLKVREGDDDEARRLLSLPRLHPAADESTRRDADALLRELGEDDGSYAALSPEAPDAAALRDLALEVIATGTRPAQRAG